MTGWLWIGGLLLILMALLLAFVDPDDEPPMPKSGMDL